MDAADEETVRRLKVRAEEITGTTERLGRAAKEGGVDAERVYEEVNRIASTLYRLHDKLEEVPRYRRERLIEAIQDAVSRIL